MISIYLDECVCVIDFNYDKVARELGACLA